VKIMQLKHAFTGRSEDRNGDQEGVTAWWSDLEKGGKKEGRYSDLITIIEFNEKSIVYTLRFRGGETQRERGGDPPRRKRGARRKRRGDRCPAYQRTRIERMTCGYQIETT